MSEEKLKTLLLINPEDRNEAKKWILEYLDKIKEEGYVEKAYASELSEKLHIENRLCIRAIEELHEKGELYFVDGK